MLGIRENVLGYSNLGDYQESWGAKVKDTIYLAMHGTNYITRTATGLNELQISLYSDIIQNNSETH